MAQFGGIGNVARAVDHVEALADREPFREFFDDWPRPWRFRDPDETETRLVRSGFTDVDCWVTEFRYVPDDPEGFLWEVVAGAHLERLPVDQREEFMAELLPSFEGDYEMDGVRLNVCATRAV